MMFKLSWIVVNVIYFGIYFPVCSQSAVLQREIGKIIRHESQIDYNLVPGIAVGVWDQDTTFHSFFGNKIDSAGIYELGSVTKPILAWLVDSALDSLSWNKDVSICTFLPDSLCFNDLNRLTIDHLLLHRGGIERLPRGIGRFEYSVQDPYANYFYSQLATDLKGIKAVPGMYSYSHTGYAIFHWLFEKVGGLESFTKRKMIQPLDMQNSGWSFPDEKISIGHGMDGRVQPPWHTNALSPAIGFKSSLTDMLSFVRSISVDLAGRSPERTKELKKQINSISKSGAFMVEQGWFLIRSGSSLVYYHNGRTGGHHVSIAFIPNRNLGVVVISNGSLGSNDLSLLILNMLRRAQK